MNIDFYAFSEIAFSNHAGFTHSFELASSMNEFEDVSLFMKPPKEKKEKEYGFLNYLDVPTSVKDLLNPYSLLKLKKQKDYIVKNRLHNVDLVYERFYLPNFLTKKIAREVPVILEVNGPITEQIHNYPLIKNLSSLNRKEVFNSVDLILTQTKTLKNKLKNLTETEIKVVSNGVDTNKFKPSLYSKKLRRKLGVREDETLITFLGSFRKWHGVHHIPKIADKIDGKFLLIGDGEMFNQVKDNKKDNMILTGSIPHKKVPKYLASSDILIAPFDANYFKEREFWWCPIKLFEYMASGKPIVSFNYKEIRKITGQPNLLAKTGNLNEFKNKLKTLKNSKNKRENIGKKLRKKAEKKYDWNKKAQQTIKHIKQKELI